MFTCDFMSTCQHVNMEKSVVFLTPASFFSNEPFWAFEFQTLYDDATRSFKLKKKHQRWMFFRVSSSCRPGKVEQIVLTWRKSYYCLEMLNSLTLQRQTELTSSHRHVAQVQTTSLYFVEQLWQKIISMTYLIWSTFTIICGLLTRPGRNLNQA